MKKQNTNPEDAARIRQKAEEQLKLRKSQISKFTSEADLQKLIHELEVHQIELEMQNEELGIAKEKAEQAEEKYTELYDFAPSGYLTISREGDILDMNLAVSQMLGKERLNLLENRFALFISQETLPDFNLFVQKVFTSKTKQSCEAVIETEGNLPIYVNIEGIASKTGNLCYLTVVDITERKRTEQELIGAKEKAVESEEKYRALFINAPLSYQSLDENGCFIDINPMWTKTLGYERDEVIGKWYGDFLHPDFVEHFRINFPAFKKRGYVSDIEFKLRRKDNTYIYVSFEGCVGYTPEGKFKQTYCVFKDITEQKALEKAIIKAKEKAEESDRLKSAFLANMSHEIRTPMNGILGFAQLLKLPDLSGEEQKEFIEIIEKSGKRMLSIINDIVDISKIEAGLMELNIFQTNINRQIEYIYTFFKPEAEIKEINLSVKTTLTESEASIKTDREKVYAILTNLVKNAIKYTDSGSIELGYDLIQSKDSLYLQFYVKDTGIGIPKDRQEAMFERFIQADIDNIKARQGAGLGLAISKAYVKMLDGNIWVESEEGEGSTFYFTLPYNTKYMINNTEQQDTPFENNDTVRKLKIMIAEDDYVSEILLTNFISKFGIEILKARTGCKAVELCRDNPDIDLIMMDIQMPEMNGYNATKQIREFNKEVIIIAQTAYGLTGDREKSIEAGCNDYIAKPINRKELQTMIQKYFGK